MSGTPERGAPVVIVTGANRGTGQAVADQLEGAGARVWRLNRSPSGTADARELLCDLADVPSVSGAVARVLDTEGRLDAIVANAAERYIATVAELDLARWNHALTVNLTSVVALVNAALPALRASRGSVILMGSHAGTRFFEGGVSYCAAKAAFKALCEVLLLEERPNGVRTALISPGAIANRDGDESTVKMSTASVARVVRWILDAPPDIAVGEVELRPAVLAASPVLGLDRLQAV